MSSKILQLVTHPWMLAVWGFAREWALWFVAYLWSSLKDSLVRKTTWVAITCTAVLFWSGGYWVGADRKRDAVNVMNAAIERMAEAKTAEARLASELLTAKTRIQALTEQLEDVRAAKVPVVPPAKPAPKPKAKPVVAPVSAPAVPAWSPFSK